MILSNVVLIYCYLLISIINTVVGYSFKNYKYFIYKNNLSTKLEATSINTNEAVKNEANDCIGGFGIRLDARKITKEDFNKYDGKVPVLITHAFDCDHEWITGEIINRFKDNLIEYDVRQSADCLISSYEANFMDFIASLPDNSVHEDSMYLMNEDLLRNEEDLNDQFRLNEDLFEKDLFQYFPDKIRPHSALIIGGVGARSFLHADPYEWTGWNYLLEGKKLWTFLSPEHCDSERNLLDFRRNAPDAWGKHKIAAGWISDIDLYKYQVSDSMLEILPDIKKGIYMEGLSTLSKCWAQEILKGDTKKRNRNANIPVFASGIKCIDESEDPSLIKGSYQIVQEEGDLIIIPPKYWHQVYHLQPSIAIASQYINSNVKNQVFSHILKWCHENPADNRDINKEMLTTLPNDFEKMTDREQICLIIKSGLIERHGLEKGKKLFLSLMTEK